MRSHRSEMQNQMGTTMNVADWYNAGNSFSVFDDVQDLVQAMISVRYVEGREPFHICEMFWRLECGWKKFWDGFGRD
jgi:hypothetical protein